MIRRAFADLPMRQVHYRRAGEGPPLLDGVGLYPDEDRRELVAEYARPIELDLIGSQYLRAFMSCRDQYIFWPWYETGRENRRDGGLPSPAVLHDCALEVCKALGTYHLGHRAAFASPVRERLPLLRTPALFVASENDPRADYTREAAALVADARFQTLRHSAEPDFAAGFTAAVEGYLSQPGA